MFCHSLPKESVVAAAKQHVPPGFVWVSEGVTQLGDICFNGGTGQWYTQPLATPSNPSLNIDLGLPMGEYWGVARPDPQTVVVHVDDPDGYGVYIGRANRTRGLKASIWQNPFKVGHDGAREQCITWYEERLRALLFGKEADEWQAALRALQGKRLGCWCAPRPCHGHVLVRLLTELLRMEG
ncbi:MAG: DUF4326 domain-containing protein [Anaerolineae bacterium]|nr:DUF4326 domain-containing protein [Anaerolineae bacterium]